MKWSGYLNIVSVASKFDEISPRVTIGIAFSAFLHSVKNWGLYEIVGTQGWSGLYTSTVGFSLSHVPWDGKNVL